MPKDLEQLLSFKTEFEGDRMPVVFLRHGSPMKTIEDNSFTCRLVALGQEITKLKAILVVSAHWLGVADDKDDLNFEAEGCDKGSISMRCLSLGKKRA